MTVTPGPSASLPPGHAAGPRHAEPPGLSPRPARRRPRPARRRRRLVQRALVVGAGLVLLVAAPALWVRANSAGHLHTTDDAPAAPVVIVFGAQLAPGGAQPMPFLKGRLDAATELVKDGKARAVLVSGDRDGTSGDEIAVMTAYLVAAGVPAERIVGDPYGLDSYDTCKRAHDVYAARRALLVSQSLHLPRAVTLCRHLGIDASGVAARCDGCRTVTLAKNTAREVPAAWKVAYDLMADRPPAVSSAPDPALQQALDE
ncbi:ElyC/SanA/YdcF family protein [Micromonospora sp. WMMA1363]|uniref:SanA/YdcF family protein n=1 Tax=Micromonospora sp. WMMA1363 TaxID=3053985 RepID=UPI00259CB711|nr:ElyC/SanA/YdcF family protein [Micromonospora sp. WMMA1363]MDM4719614.1 ElyC/SanA/YdcF family protein [Micromonospora sp. WMMA1363]